VIGRGAFNNRVRQSRAGVVQRGGREVLIAPTCSSEGVNAGRFAPVARRHDKPPLADVLLNYIAFPFKAPTSRLNRPHLRRFIRPRTSSACGKNHRRSNCGARSGAHLNESGRCPHVKPAAALPQAFRVKARS
jgi:hypothetical protein